MNLQITHSSNISIDPYELIGQDRFIRYKGFIDEFKLYILSTPLKPLIKLINLKTWVKGDARDPIKSFNHAEKLNDDSDALENAYSKPDFVTTEIYKNPKMMPSCPSLKNIKSLKSQAHTLKVTLSTLKKLEFKQLFLGDRNV